MSDSLKEKYEQLALIENNKSITQLNNTKYTYKAHSLIEMSYELNVTEQRILALACKKLKPIYIENDIVPEDLDKIKTVMTFTRMKITVNEYKNEYNIKNKNVYAIVSKTVSELFNRKIYYYSKGKLKMMRWIASAEYDEGEGSFYLTLNPDLISQLLVIKSRYVAIMFDLSQEIRSKYAHRLYEILKSYVADGVYRVSLEDLRFMLCIDETHYKSFNLLNAKVIKPNVESINKYSDISVECKNIKNGRTVTHLEFIISRKEGHIPAIDIQLKDSIPKAYEKIENALNKLNISLSDSDIALLLDHATNTTITNHINIPIAEYIVEKIEYMGNVLVDMNIKNVMGFLIHCIKNNIKGVSLVENKKPKTRFHNFTGREMTKEEFDDLENQLLGWDDEVTL